MTQSDSNGLVYLLKRIQDIDVDYAVNIIGGSEEMYEKILIRIIRQIPANVEHMDISLRESNGLDDFKIKAHGVKSSIRQIGNIRLSLLAEELEAAAKEGNKPYCEEHYVSFRKELLQFYETVDAAISECSKDGGCIDKENEPISSICDFLDVLAKVKAAAEAYDTITATELLTPLTKRRFGGNTDTLITKSMEALDIFKPKKALEYLEELMNSC